MKSFPISPVNSDLSGAVKKETLEFFILNPDWHKARELMLDPLLGSTLLQEDSRAIQMRLKRYVNQGILIRRRAKRGFEYKITTKGEDRLFFLWEKFGDTSDKGKHSQREIERTSKLLDVKIAVLERRASARAR